MAVAVLIVNYRAYAELDRALRSLRPHLGPADEVVVVDQASDPAAIARLAAAHTRARFLARAGNSGFAAGVNAAARASAAPYLLLLNPDTDVEAPIVRALESWLERHPATGVVGPRVVNADGTIQPSARRFPGLSTVFGGRSTWLTRRFPRNWFSRRNLSAAGSEGPVNVDWVAGSCFMTRRDLFDRLGGLDERFFLYWEDADYCRRAAALGYASTYLPGVTVRHFAGASAQHDLARAIRTFHRSAYRLYWKHAGPAGRLAAPLVGAGLLLRGELRVLQARLAQRGAAA